MAKDPVSGMYVDEKTAKVTRTIRGTKWYFCSETCANTFEKPEIEVKRLKQLSRVYTEKRRVLHVFRTKNLRSSEKMIIGADRLRWPLWCQDE
jgi:YHS domain-containing protein